MAVRGQASKTNVQPIQQTQPKILPDLQAMSAIDQFKALLANMSPEERKQAQSLVKPPKRDMVKLLDVRGKVQAYASKLMFETFQENVDPKDALGIVWKAAWPKKYYRVDEQGNRIKLANGAFDSWEPGGYANSKPDWVKNKECELVRLENGQEVVEEQEHENGDE